MKREKTEAETSSFFPTKSRFTATETRVFHSLKFFNIKKLQRIKAQTQEENPLDNQANESRNTPFGDSFYKEGEPSDMTYKIMTNTFDTLSLQVIIATSQ
jgi:hypothetical protein